MSKKYSGWKMRTIGVLISISIAEVVGILSALLTKDNGKIQRTTTTFI